jgi:hypothetical protein
MANYKKSLVLVQEHLDEGESVHVSVFGAYETKLMGNDTVRNGIFVATEKRLIFFAKKFFGFDLETFPYKSVSSIEQSKGMMGRSITVFASGNKAKMKWIRTGDVAQFTHFVNSKLGHQGQENSQATPSNGDDIPSQIQKLSELKDKGILTEEEFLNKKNELLAKM